MNTATALANIPKETKKRVPRPPFPGPKLSYSFKEAEKATSLCRRTLEYAIKEGKLKALKIGRRTIIPAKSLEKFISGGGA